MRQGHKTDCLPRCISPLSLHYELLQNILHGLPLLTFLFHCFGIRLGALCVCVSVYTLALHMHISVGKKTFLLRNYLHASVRPSTLLPNIARKTFNVCCFHAQIEDVRRTVMFGMVLASCKRPLIAARICLCKLCFV